MEPDRNQNERNNVDGEASAEPSQLASEPSEQDYSQNTQIAEEAPPETSIEDLTLDQLLSRFARAPKRTWRHTRLAIAGAESMPAAEFATGEQALVDAARRATARPGTARIAGALRQGQNLQLLIFFLALVSAVIGTNALLGPPDGNRSAENTLEIGAPFLWLGFFAWLIGEAVGSADYLRSRWQNMSPWRRIRCAARIMPIALWLAAFKAISDSMSVQTEQSFELLQIGLGRLIAGFVLWYLIDFLLRQLKARLPETPETSETEAGTAEETSDNAGSYRSLTKAPIAPTAPSATDSLPLQAAISKRRIGLVICSALASALLWINTSGNRIEPPFIVLWILSSFAWAMVFAPANWNAFEWLSQWIDRWRRNDWQHNRWLLLAFALIMLLGISFRFTRLHSVPPEMTSDHVEKIQDAYSVYSGDYQIFFPNNGGREPLQMYLLSMLSTLPGLGFDFYTLKFLAVIESVLTLPLLFCMGRELLGGGRSRFNTIVALLLTALVAASYWHVIISRQGLRIPLTPAVTAVLLIYLSRAMRQNKRGDYIKAALVLGFGLYTYQAVRMLPVLIVIGLLFAIWMRADSWRERRRYLFHLAILVFVSLMVFLPMLHFWHDFPNLFWMRTSTRILGDELAFATSGEAMEAVRVNVTVFMRNLRDALLMYNWKGDIGWFNGAPQHPVLDTLTGAFLILGAAAWLAKMIKSRDPVVWFMPVALLVMLMPTVLSLAHPEANPSNSRALGSAPIVYLIAALPVAMMTLRLKRMIKGTRGKAIAIVFAASVVLFANHQNSETYFNRYANAYIGPAFPHSEAGRIVRGFATSDGAIGNVWSVGFPYWWDYRALGIEAGYPLWHNDMHPLENLPQILSNAQQRNGPLRLDPDRDLLFLFNPADEETWQRLRGWFPSGRAMTIQSYHPDDQYVLYRVPRLDEEAWASIIAIKDDYQG